VYRFVHTSLALCTLMVASRAAAQQTTAQPSREQLLRANTLFTQSDWRGAYEAYSALAKAYPSHPLARFRVGVTALELGNLGEAETSLLEGERLGVPEPQAAYRLGQLRAEQGRAADAIAELTRSAAAGMFLPASALQSDRHLRSLKANARWSSVLDAFDAVVQPCRHDERFREFDFWLGDWDVRTTGQPPVGPAARNIVTLDDNACVVTEHWSAPSGSVGQSFNIFDRSVGQWRQTWVDNVGGQHDYRGSLQNGNMVYVGDTPAPNGQRGRVPTRLTFFHISKDSVRQFSETSNDSGRTGQASYDLMYVRRPATASPLLDADRAAIVALDSAYVRAWLNGDTTAVLDLFAADAVLLPPGVAPVTGTAGIRAFWWPADGSRTRITSFTRHVDELSGDDKSVVLRATSTLAWESTKAGKTTRQTSRSTDLVILRQGADGRWRIVRQMWNQLP
jgi:uncharacterized protein (TIGR02246 family)